MIKQFKEINFGSYKDFKWKWTDEKYNFNKINIIYGRNYSGKTTLSRIARSFELKNIHKDFGGSSFKISLENGEITEKDIENHSLNIKVYNSDFIKDNLSYLYDDNGDIKGFKTLGEKNTNLLKEIEELENKLGKKSSNEENASGLYLELEILEKEYELVSNDLNKKKNDLEKALTDKAKNISANRYLVEHGKTYNKPDLKRELKYVLEYYMQTDLLRKVIDIKELENLYDKLIKQNNKYKKIEAQRQVSSETTKQKNKELEYIINEINVSSIGRYIKISYNYDKLLSELKHLMKKLKNNSFTINNIEKEELIRIIKYEKLEKIDFKINFSNEVFSKILEKVKLLLSTKIIDHFNITVELRNWLKDGVAIHNNDNNMCKFCHNNLSKERWGELENIINFKIEEVQKLQNSLKNIQNKINKSMLNEEYLLNKLTKYNFYSHLQLNFEKKVKTLQTRIKKYNKSLTLIKSNIEKKLKNVYEPIILNNIFDNTKGVFSVLQLIDKICNTNNMYGENLEKEKLKTFEVLRYEEIIQYYFDSKYGIKIIDIKNLENKKYRLKNNIATVKEKIKEQKNEIKAKQKILSHLDLSVKNINKYLKSYFGHNALEIEIGEDSNERQTFTILRNKKPAKNLSEGECNLVAFCYFIAILKAEDNTLKPIIWIDDPISSLDNNHIFFIFSLIENEIIRKEFDNQIFISTHNLEFLKYLKRLKKSKPKQNDEDKTEYYYPQYYLIEKNIHEDIETSEIKKLPKYLEKYTTEFNYLFEQIYNFRYINDVENEDLEATLVYNFGNNLRKFLEIYLFFKYPNNFESLDREQIERFIHDTYQNDNLERSQKIIASIINRYQNEYSHLRDMLDRGMQPIDIKEAKEIASFLLKVMKKNDKKQFKALERSISKATVGTENKLEQKGDK